MDRPIARRQARLTYPHTRTVDVIDDYHGIRIADPYRWLEDADSDDTRLWVAAQNALTRTLLDTPDRQGLVDELTRLYNYPRTSVPLRRGPHYFFTFNSGLQNQPVLYVQAGPGARPRVLLDPNTLSEDGTAALTAFFPNDEGSLLAYGVSMHGSDRQEFYVRDVRTGTDLPDHLHWIKFASVAWAPQGEGFYYTRFPEPGTVPDGDEQYFPKVCYHRLGTPQEDDPVIFERADDREIVFSVDMTDDGRWAVITAFKGASDRSEVYLLDRRDDAVVPLFTTFAYAWRFIGDADARLLFITDQGAPRSRIVSVDPDRARAVAEVVPERAGTLTAAAVTGGTLAVCHLTNASDAITLYTAAGEPAGAIELAPFVSVIGIDGARTQGELTLGVWSYTQPPAAFRYDVSTRVLMPFDPASVLEPGSPALRPSGSYVTRQVWFASKDGTPVSMFLVHQTDLEMDGARPVLLTGYGGFNINMTPMFDPGNRVLLDRGGVLAVPQLRGGGEYGEAWHQAGTLERKQAVFDDFIAAAQWLIDAGVTTARRLSIEGGSNGGLLTAAVALQRPELFGAVIARVPVADMLRYHLFTIGRFWIREYGCADDPVQFGYLLRYSPYHNIVSGHRYPPVLVTTADTDDRVAPGMAKKFVARLQAEAAGGPFLIRVDTKAGHGAGKPVTKMIEEDADIFAFLQAAGTFGADKAALQGCATSMSDVPASDRERP
jgi:prolyl oligopeptidase